MFAYFRYFSVASFVLVLALAAGLGWYFQDEAGRYIIGKPLEKLSVSLVRSFATSIWANDREALQPFLSQKSDNWQHNPLATSFAQRTGSHFQSAPILKLNFYNGAGERFFSNNEREIIFVDSGNDFAEARQGRIVSRVLHDIALRENSQLTKGSAFRVYVPIVDGRTRKLDLVLEIYYDITQPWQTLHFFQILITSGMALLCTVLYLALFFTSHRSTLIINKQHEANLELTKAKVRAEAENQEKSKFLANVSHELRTPLNAIIGFSEIVKDEVMGPINNQQYKEYIKDINASGIHLLSLINDILDFSKAEANKLDVEFVDVDVIKLLRTSARLVLPRAQEAKVELIESMPREHIIMKADPKRLKQVVLNLLSNAVKFTPEGGKVTLIARPNETRDQLIVEVVDTGIGIAPKDISKAMATFGQVDNKLSRRYEGTGLGLPLTKKLVELMKGVFEIKSELGFGTTVTLHFPLTASQPISAEAITPVTQSLAITPPLPPSASATMPQAAPAPAFPKPQNADHFAIPTSALAPTKQPITLNSPGKEKERPTVFVPPSMGGDGGPPVIPGTIRILGEPDPIPLETVPVPSPSPSALPTRSYEPPLHEPPVFKEEKTPG